MVSRLQSSFAMTKLRVFAIGLFLSLGVGLAYADSLTVNDVTFTATVTGTTATLQVQCINTAVCGNWYLGDVTLKGFTYTGTPTLGTAPAGYTLVPGGQNNSAVGSGGGCNGNKVVPALCWDAASTLSALGGGVHTFTANLSGGVAGTLDVQATAYNNKYGFQWGGGKVLAVSSPLQPGSHVPEPNALVLLGSGFVLFLTVLVALRMRRHRRQVAEA